MIDTTLSPSPERRRSRMDHPPMTAEQWRWQAEFCRLDGFPALEWICLEEAERLETAIDWEREL